MAYRRDSAPGYRGTHGDSPAKGALWRPRLVLYRRLRGTAGSLLRARLDQEPGIPGRDGSALPRFRHPGGNRGAPGTVFAGNFATGIERQHPVLPRLSGERRLWNRGTASPTLHPCNRRAWQILPRRGEQRHVRAPCPTGLARKALDATVFPRRGPGSLLRRTGRFPGRRIRKRDGNLDKQVQEPLRFGASCQPSKGAFGEGFRSVNRSRSSSHKRDLTVY